MNNFYVIPYVEDGEGKIRVLQSEHNGRTRTLYEDAAPLPKLKHMEREFRKAIDELEAIQRQREYTKDAREIREELTAWKAAAID